MKEDDQGEFDLTSRIFDGETYVPALDNARLCPQAKRVYDAMKDGQWRTFSEIEEITEDPPQSISARLRDFRKRRFGNHTVNRRARGDRSKGLFEYQLITNGQLLSGERNHEH